jgi:hypothetical protein
MTQNTSHAVMAQRHEAHDSLDDFPTPPWAVRALLEHVIAVNRHHDTVWEPACNRGYMVKGLQGYFREIEASDIHNYGGHRVADFLFPGPCPSVDWIITNPPFRLAEQFAHQAIARCGKGVALLVRTQFLESIGRHERLFVPRKPLIVAQFVERVPMVKGRCDPHASTATAYCWVVWTKEPTREATEFLWIPPCRSKLERADDYFGSFA